MGCRFPDAEYDSSFNFTNTLIFSSPGHALNNIDVSFCCAWTDKWRSAGGLCALPKYIKFEDFSWNQLPKGLGIRYTAEQAFRTHEFRQKSLHGLTIEWVDFTGSDFSGFTLGFFEYCNFEGANFKDAMRLLPMGGRRPGHIGSKFGFENCHNLTNEQLEQTHFWKRGDVTGMVLENLNLDDWDFSNKDLSQVSFAWSSVRNAKFENAHIRNTSITQGIAISSPATLTSSSPTSLTVEQLQQTRSWKEKQIIGCIIYGVDFKNQDLSGFDFRSTAFILCTFGNANLVGADVTGAMMTFNKGETISLTEEQLRSLQFLHKSH